MINDSRPRLDTNRKSEFTTVEQETDAHEEAVAAQLAQWAKPLPALLAKFPWTLPRTLLGPPDNPRRPGRIRHSVTVLRMDG